MSSNTNTASTDMKNIVVKVEGTTLTITVDLTKTFGPSSSGKSTVIASTCGNKPVPGREDIKMGINLYK